MYLYYCLLIFEAEIFYPSIFTLISLLMCDFEIRPSAGLLCITKLSSLGSALWIYSNHYLCFNKNIIP